MDRFSSLASGTTPLSAANEPPPPHRAQAQTWFMTFGEVLAGAFILGD